MLSHGWNNGMLDEITGWTKGWNVTRVFAMTRVFAIAYGKFWVDEITECLDEITGWTNGT
jgi:hypothetical protein